MTVHLRREKCCTHESGCIAPIYEANLCAAHYRSCTSERLAHTERFTVEEDRERGLFMVRDSRVGVVLTTPFADEAFDRLLDLRAAGEEQAA